MRYALTAALVSLLAGCGAKVPIDGRSARSSPERPSAPGGNACAAPVLGPGDHDRVLRVGGRDRRYRLHVPRGYVARTPTAVVISLHGHDSSATRHEELARFSKVADQEGFVLVMPEGTGKMTFRDTWNAGRCCGAAVEYEVDDVAFVRELIHAAGDDVCVDPGRVFVAGFGSGAMLAHRLACELSDRIVAVAAVAGGLMDRDPRGGAPTFVCTPTHPVSILAIHGDRDACIPYQGAAGGASCRPGRRRCKELYPPVPDVMAAWAARNACDGPPTRTVLARGATTCATSACAAGVDVELCTIAGGGHDWPGGDHSARRSNFCPGGDGATSDDIDASRRIWAFFAAHPRPARP